MDVKWKTIVERAGPTLLVIMIIAYFAGGWDAIPQALVAWGTILLAYMTYLLARTSKDQNDRLIAENVERENRDRKERLLNEIIEWAIPLVLQTEGEATKYLLNLQIKPNIISDIRDNVDKFIRNISATIGRITYILHMSSKFGIELNKTVIETASELKDYLDYLIGWEEVLDENIQTLIIIQADEENLKRAKDVDNYRYRLSKLAHKIIEEASKIKTETIS
jgi:TM2 domain-containing membrane protein YozV